jgi:hypothetical protein
VFLPAVLTLKLVICPALASLAIKGIISYVNEPIGKKIPQGPIAAVLEMAIKMMFK